MCPLSRVLLRFALERGLALRTTEVVNLAIVFDRDMSLVAVDSFPAYGIMYEHDSSDLHKRLELAAICAALCCIRLRVDASNRAHSGAVCVPWCQIYEWCVGLALPTACAELFRAAQRANSAGSCVISPAAR